MNLNDYQTLSRKTATYPGAGKEYYYPAFGLVSEAGEVADKIKKNMRNDNGIWTDEAKMALCDELGDVLWYVAQLATEFDTTLENIANRNIEKLTSRQQRGVINSTGDYR